MRTTTLDEYTFYALPPLMQNALFLLSLRGTIATIQFGYMDSFKRLARAGLVNIGPMTITMTDRGAAIMAAYYGDEGSAA